MLYTNNFPHMFEYMQNEVTHNKFFEEKKECKMGKSSTTTKLKI